MLASATRLAIRRQLTTATAARAPLAPPYAHSNRSALAPPYTHVVDSRVEDRLQPAHSFTVTLPDTSVGRAPSPTEWTAELLATPEGREWALAAWNSTLEELAQQPANAPEIKFQSLGAILADPKARAFAVRAGSVVVRDVVRDGIAEAWAAEILEAKAEREQHATYYSPAHVAARADASVLSATAQALRAFLPETPEGAYIRVDDACSAPSPSSWAAKDLWTVPESASVPIHAHLALARTSLCVPTSAAAATYALLRPYFAPKASRLSFYSPSGYLAAENWRLRSQGERADPDAELTHLKPATVDLAPGDVLVSHAGAPLAAADDAGLVLPVHPLPATEGNRAFVALQRASFEAGLPPPHTPNSNTPVMIEDAGEASWIDSWGGRRAMGYN